MTDFAPVQLPRLNEPAPAFDAPTTHGRKTLADYKGKWLILFSHPADFTPVCTTEFIAFAKAQDRFSALNVELLGLSIDSHYAHIAWVRNIKEKFGVEIGFPIIADLSMNVAHAYGMVQPGASDTAAVRATFLIDPEGFCGPWCIIPCPMAARLRSLSALCRRCRRQIARKWLRLKAGSRATG